MTTWERYLTYVYRDSELGLELDVSRMPFYDRQLPHREGKLRDAFAAMRELEAGAVANPSEGRQVGHYWLRAPELAPSAEAGRIQSCIRRVKNFVRQVHLGEVVSPSGKPFSRFILIGIGGSALGPQLLLDALAGTDRDLQPHFLDNTDPDGFDRVLAEVRPYLDETLVLVCSKSGDTRETLNGMAVLRAAFREQNLDFSGSAVAVTVVRDPGEEQGDLAALASVEGWLEVFPIWDWVGGRTSFASAIGLLPAGLVGIDTAALLDGARRMDAATRVEDAVRNPAALMALTWDMAAEGRGPRDMVVLPYRDRLELLGRYLQQLVMESLGKSQTADGRRMHPHGFAVYGNKGSTDQHSYMQQLRDGPDNYFALFVRVLEDMHPDRIEVTPGRTSGDYLHGFWQGTRRALTERMRSSITITLDRLDAASLGALLALFERTVGLYAAMMQINAYDQPGVQAGKRAAEDVLELQDRVLQRVSTGRKWRTAAELAQELDGADAEEVYHLLRHLAAHPQRGIERKAGATADQDRFCWEG